MSGKGEQDSKIVDIAQWKEARLLSERRRHERAVLSQAVQGELVTGSANRPLAIVLFQLSRGGCCFSLTQPLRENSLHIDDNITLILSLGPGIQLEAKARIVHVTLPIREGRSPTFGAEFDIEAVASGEPIPQLVDFLDSYISSFTVPSEKNGS